MKLKFNGILTLLLALTVQFVFAQKTVSGVVSDESGPLPGVSVLIKGTKTGTETDFDGKYSLQAKAGDVLQFSYVGMVTQDITVGNSNVYNVKLTPDANVLEEVVVTAFGIKREKKSVTYQTEKVSQDDLNKGQASTVSSGLVGKVAGLNVNIENNGVKPSVNINLRGSRSITQSNAALVVIDGVQATSQSLADLNPNDVETINVLKGANAAALYGADAANGALIVTTKKGKDQSFKVNVNSSTLIEEVAYMPEFQTEFGPGNYDMYNAVENTNWGPRFDGTMRVVGPELADGTRQMLPYSPVKDNLKNFFNTGYTLQNSISFSGGSDNSNYYLSIGDQRTNGITLNDKYNKTSFRINADKKIGKLTFGVNSSLMFDNSDIAGNNAGEQERALYWYILNTTANIPLENYKDWRNDKWSKPENFYNAYYENPYWLIDNHRESEKTNRFNTAIYGSWDINDFANFTVKTGFNKRIFNGKSFHAASDFKGVTYNRPNPATSHVTEEQSSSLIINGNAVLTLDFNLTEDLTLKPLFGFDAYSYEYQFSSIRANNLIIPGFYDISNGSGELEGSVDAAQLRRYGLFTDITLGYKNYLFLNVTGRNDWTSTLDTNNNSYFYPSVGLSLVATDAIPSLKNDLLNFLKLTASYSKVFNDVGEYQINERYFQASSFPFSVINGFDLSTTTVKDGLKPEKITTNEFGLNTGMLDNAVTLDLAYYFGGTVDLINRATTAPSTGASTILTNLGELESKGFEASLGLKLFREKKFNWDISTNYSQYKSVVTKLVDGLDEIAVQNSFGTYGVYAIKGEQFPYLKAVAYVRDPEGRVVINPETGNPIVGSVQKMGQTTPDFVIGLTNNFSYKGLSLSATLDYRTGHVYYSQLADQMEFTGYSMESVSSNRQEFIYPNSSYETSSGVYVANTNIQTTGASEDLWKNEYNDIKENYVKDATALKLREVALTYDFGGKKISNKISALKVGFVARNLLTFLPKENRFSDPEFNGTDNSTYSSPNTNSMGISGYYQSPPTRTFGLNINLTF